ncbi:hypothetical protein C2845_PM15G13710 [Panicum miliaceum]|uniref:Uncharacterized protein n=1 Tax=Panicum miliaceum TaxID=4540 RepID=A0A3L6QB06_PANMI|nr:hypothetical protein C2845_PM15G13710 [Panicum miliaceum]
MSEPLSLKLFNSMMKKEPFKPPVEGKCIFLTFNVILTPELVLILQIIRRANEAGETEESLSSRFINEIMENGHAYAIEGDVYFAVDSFPEYLQLSGRILDQNRAVNVSLSIQENIILQTLPCGSFPKRVLQFKYLFELTSDQFNGFEVLSKYRQEGISIPVPDKKHILVKEHHLDFLKYMLDDLKTTKVLDKNFMKLLKP